jgi:tRNA 5-methylaminomethyl-2-thiouridine biosynthesis bifunctional protein
LLQQYDVLTGGWHRFVLEQGRIMLTLLIGDVLETLPQLDARIDAWFLDGFPRPKTRTCGSLPCLHSWHACLRRAPVLPPLPVPVSCAVA